MDGGSLSQYPIEYFRKYHTLLPESKVWWFFIQICLGIEYLHSRNIVLRNLKISNVFMNKSEKLKIGNLDLVEEKAFIYKGKSNPLNFIESNEMNCNKKSDIWCLG